MFQGTVHTLKFYCKHYVLKRVFWTFHINGSVRASYWGYLLINGVDTTPEIEGAFRNCSDIGTLQQQSTAHCPETVVGNCVKAPNLFM